MNIQIKAIELPLSVLPLDYYYYSFLTGNLRNFVTALVFSASRGSSSRTCSGELSGSRNAVMFFLKNLTKIIGSI